MSENGRTVITSVRVYKSFPLIFNHSFAQFSAWISATFIMTPANNIHECGYLDEEENIDTSNRSNYFVNVSGISSESQSESSCPARDNILSETIMFLWFITKKHLLSHPWKLHFKKAGDLIKPLSISSITNKPQPIEFLSHHN